MGTIMSQRYIRIFSNIIKVGLYILPFSVLIVAGNFWGKLLMPGVGDLFFPFITGKNFFFRIVVELLFALWAFIAIFDKRYRPRATPLFWSIVATAAALTLSTIFGESPYRSFWSNYERMEGLVGHLHLLGYFVVLTSVLRTEIDWRRFFSCSIVASALVSGYAYLQWFGVLAVHQSSERLDATLGNATYLAIYIVFHLFLIVFLWQKTQKITTKYLLAALFILELPVVFLTATRGAILGLFGGSILFSVLLTLTSREKILRKWALGIIAFVVLVGAIFYAAKDTELVKNNYVLKRFANLSFSEQTVTSRLTIWKMALRGLRENSVLGWGPENFNLVFNKYYEPELWQQEPWFDRAHMIVFDWLISAGILGFLAYISIFISAFYLMWKSFSKIEIALFVSLLAVYCFHNLFVFDNFTSYFMFFSILGFIHCRYRYQATDQKESYVEKIQPVAPTPFHFMGAASVWIAVVLILYFVTAKPLLASRALLGALRDSTTKGREVDFMLSDFDKVFSYRTFGTIEGREQMVGYANLVLSSDLPNAEKAKVVQRTTRELEKQIAEFPKDTRGYIFLASSYIHADRTADAVRVLDKALQLSPKKQQIFFIMTDAYINAKDYAKALEYAKRAYDLDQSFGGAAKNVALISILKGDQAYAEGILEKHYGKRLIADQQLLNAYAQVNNYSKVRDIWLLFVESAPNDAQYRVNLAATYLKLGSREKAIQQIQKAIEINPNFKDQGEYFIREIRAGRNP